MAVSISVPDNSWSTQQVSLSGRVYTFEFKYNDRSKRWYIDLYLGGELIIGSLKVMENVTITKRFKLDNFQDGELAVIRFKETSEPVGRDNFGIGKDYELVYLTNEEVEELGV